MGYTGIGSNGQIYTGNGGGVGPNFKTMTPPIDTIDGDTGSATPTAGVVTIYADVAALNAGSSVQFTNSGSTSTFNVTDSNSNTIIGQGAGKAGISSTQNVAFGAVALHSATSAAGNTAIGYDTLGSLSTGQNNAALGDAAGAALRTGSYNTLLGYTAGSNYVGAETSNIIISNAATSTENNVIRIGAQGTGPGQQNQCYVAGITGATPTSGNTPQVVLCDNTGNLAPISSSTSGYVLTSNGTATPSFQANSTANAIKTITGNSGGAESPSSNNFNILGTGSITSVGSAATETIQLTGLTNHALQVGAGTATLTQLGPTATAGQVLQSGGSSADPAFSTATYPSTTTVSQILYSSATNVVSGLSTANDGVLITSNTGVPSLLAAGTTGQVLTATTGSPPSWAAPATSGTVTTVSVATANGFAGTVANATTTPAITLTTSQTGVLSGNGTSITGTAITQYDVLVGGASNAIVSVGTGNAGQVLQSGGASANPAYSTAIYPSSTTINQILYSSAANTVSEITTGNSGVLVTNSSGVPSINTTDFAVLTTGVQMKGNNTNTAPPAGFIGENIVSTVIPTTVTLSTSVIANVTSINLTAGIWDLTGQVAFNGNVTGTAFVGSIVTTTATRGTDGDNEVETGTAPTYDANSCVTIPTVRLTLSSTTTVYLTADAAFTAGTCKVGGKISATRVG